VGPYLLQSEIHSSFSTDSGVWSAFKSEIQSEIGELDHQHLYNGHLLREFNRKVLTLGFDSLAFSPYDGGYRYAGEGIGGGFSANVWIGSNDDSVLDSNDNNLLN
jgi:hypothetical protein